MPQPASTCSPRRAAISASRSAMLPLQQPRLEHLHGQLAVLVLRALVLALDHDARRQVGQADGRVGLVDVLAAGAPDARYVSTRRSSSGISPISSTSSTSGSTSTSANVVWRRFCES